MLIKINQNYWDASLHGNIVDATLPPDNMSHLDAVFYDETGYVQYINHDSYELLNVIPAQQGYID